MPPYRERAMFDPELSGDSGNTGGNEMRVDLSANEAAFASESACVPDCESRLGRERHTACSVRWPADEEWIHSGAVHASNSASTERGDDVEDLEFSPDDFNLNGCHVDETPSGSRCRSQVRPLSEPGSGTIEPPLGGVPDRSCTRVACDELAAPTAQPQSPRRVGRFGILGAMILIAVIVGSAWYFAASNDLYRVETNILYMDAGPDRRAAKLWSWNQESLLLRSPQLLCMVAQDFFRSRESHPGSQPWGTVADAGKDTSASALAGASHDSTDAGPFVKWLSEELSVNAKPDSGLATISLRGENPEFLKAVLTSYLNQYQVYRSQLMRKSAEKELKAEARKDEAEQKDAQMQLQKELVELDSQIAGCRSALNNMKTRRGSFSGFQPSSRVSGIPSIDEFQKRVVELEMKKRALAVRFHPRSREINEVQKEIVGVRNAMKERISEHLRFLAEKRENLLGREKGLRSARRGIVGRTMGSASDVPHKSPDAGKGVPRQDGIYLLEKPHVTQVPFTDFTGEHVNRLFDRLSAGARNAVGWTQEELASFPFSNSVEIPSYHVKGPSDQAGEPARASAPVTEIIKNKLAAVANKLKRQVETDR